MYKTLLAPALFLSCLLPSKNHAQTILPDSVINELKKGVDGFSKRFHTPGIVVAIVHDQQLIFTEALGYTDIENKTPATIDSKFPVLSVTKTFTATMFMQLVQQKKASLVDDVKKYLPEYTGNTTLLQLATHTSGLPRNSPADIHFTKQVDRWMLTGTNDASIVPASKKEFLASLKFIRREYPEYEVLSYGDRHYSNMGYSMLGIALERAAKTGYANYVSENICKPLKMNNSGFDSENLENAGIATGYYYRDSSKGFIKTPAFKSASALYAGGMYSTARDLARFISFQLDESGAANTILSREYRNMMHSFKIGWKPAYPIVLHEGAMLGYRCQVAFNPQLKIGWVILTNTTDFEFSAMNNYFGKLLAPVFGKNVTDLNKYTGNYKLDGGYDSLEIYLKDGSLHSTYLQNELRDTRLVPTGTNRFKSGKEGNYNIGYDFILNGEGNVRCLNLGQLMWVRQ